MRNFLLEILFIIRNDFVKTATIIMAVPVNPKVEKLRWLILELLPVHNLVGGLDYHIPWRIEEPHLFSSLYL